MHRLNAKAQLKLMTRNAGNMKKKKRKRKKEKEKKKNVTIKTCVLFSIGLEC